MLTQYINRLCYSLVACLYLLAATLNAAEVNVYSARKEALIKPLLRQFEAATGTRVNLITGKADILLQRLISEGRNSPADILITTDVGRLHRAQQANVLQAIQSQILESSIPKQYREPRGYWFGFSLRARPIVYAAKRVKPQQLSTYEALASVSWGQKICIRSSDNIYNQSLVASLIAHAGEENTLAWATGLVKNLARPPQGGDRDQIKAIAAGQCDLALVNNYYLGIMQTSKDVSEQAAAKQVTVFWPNQNGRGTHVNISGGAVTAAAKNQGSAIRLLEFLVSDAAQQWYAEINLEYPIKPGIRPHDILQSWGTFKADSLHLHRLGELNAQAVMIMDQAKWK